MGISSPFLIASKNDGQYDFGLITSEYDYAVMSDSNEKTFNQINAKNKISYRYSAKYKNAESGGNLAFRIKQNGQNFQKFVKILKDLAH